MRRSRAASAESRIDPGQSELLTPTQSLAAIFESLARAMAIRAVELAATIDNPQHAMAIASAALEKMQGLEAPGSSPGTRTDDDRVVKIMEILRSRKDSTDPELPVPSQCETSSKSPK